MNYNNKFVNNQIPEVMTSKIPNMYINKEFLNKEYINQELTQVYFLIKELDEKLTKVNTLLFNSHLKDMSTSYHIITKNHICLLKNYINIEAVYNSNLIYDQKIDPRYEKEYLDSLESDEKYMELTSSMIELCQSPIKKKLQINAPVFQPSNNSLFSSNNSLFSANLFGENFYKIKNDENITNFPNLNTNITEINKTMFSKSKDLKNKKRNSGKERILKHTIDDIDLTMDELLRVDIKKINPNSIYINSNCKINDDLIAITPKKYEFLNNNNNKNIQLFFTQNETIYVYKSFYYPATNGFIYKLDDKTNNLFLSIYNNKFQKWKV